MRFLHFILASLFRSKRRTILTVLSLAVSVFLVALMQSLLGTLDALSVSPPGGGGGYRVAVQDKASFTNVIPQAYANFLKQQPEVEAICGMQWFGGEYKDPKNFFANFAVDPETYTSVYREESGLANIPPEQLRDWLRDGNACVVGQALADKFGWKLGDVVPLRSPIFNLALRLNIRIIYKGMRKSDEMMLAFHLKQLQEAVPWMKGRVGMFTVRVRDQKDVPRLIERIDRNFANSSPETLSMTENAFNLNMMKMLGDYTDMLHSISAAVLVAILIVTANTMAMAIRERTAEISVMRAIGFTSGKILSLLVSEGLILSLMGSLLGILMALGAASVVSGFMGEIIPWMADFFIRPDTLLLCVLLTLGIGLLSTFVPAYRASRRRITDGLRAL
jgi:putative ABC transport system permease protein